MRFWFPPGRPALKANSDTFALFVRANPDFQFFFPDYKSSPWHVQARSTEGTIVNFWPHLLKGNMPGETAVVGLDRLNKLLDRVRREDNEEDIDLIERDK